MSTSDKRRKAEAKACYATKTPPLITMRLKLHINQALEAFDVESLTSFFYMLHVQEKMSSRNEQGFPVSV